MEQVSEYFAGLSGDSRARYTAKVTALGLTVDPYSLPKESWVGEPEKIPEVSWSDMFLYMIQTPSAYTKEEMKVGTSVEFPGNYSSVCTLYRHGKVW